jgi:type IV pilus assembly protein PilE
MPSRIGGFTLMELVVTMTIIAILAAVAIPIYTEQVAKGRRAEGRVSLLEAANAMERAFTVNNRYPTTLAAAGYKIHSGDNPTDGHYDLAVAATDTTFTLTATPRRADATCGAFSLTHTGVRTYSGSGTARQCWGG